MYKTRIMAYVVACALAAQPVVMVARDDKDDYEEYYKAGGFQTDEGVYMQAYAEEQQRKEQEEQRRTAMSEREKTYAQDYTQGLLGAVGTDIPTKEEMEEEIEARQQAGAREEDERRAYWDQLPTAEERRSEEDARDAEQREREWAADAMGISARRQKNLEESLEKMKEARKQAQREKQEAKERAAKEEQERKEQEQKLKEMRIEEKKNKEEKRRALSKSEEFKQVGREERIREAEQRMRADEAGVRFDVQAHLEQKRTDVKTERAVKRQKKEEARKRAQEEKGQKKRQAEYAREEQKTRKEKDKVLQAAYDNDNSGWFSGFFKRRQDKKEEKQTKEAKVSAYEAGQKAVERMQRNEQGAQNIIEAAKMQDSFDQASAQFNEKEWKVVQQAEADRARYDQPTKEEVEALAFQQEQEHIEQQIAAGLADVPVAAQERMQQAYDAHRQRSRIGQIQRTEARRLQQEKAAAEKRKAQALRDEKQATQDKIKAIEESGAYPAEKRSIFAYFEKRKSQKKAAQQATHDEQVAHAERVQAYQTDYDQRNSLWTRVTRAYDEFKNWFTNEQTQSATALTGTVPLAMPLATPQVHEASPVHPTPPALSSVSQPTPKKQPKQVVVITDPGIVQPAIPAQYQAVPPSSSKKESIQVSPQSKQQLQDLQRQKQALQEVLKQAEQRKRAQEIEAQNQVGREWQDYLDKQAARYNEEQKRIEDERKQSNNGEQLLPAVERVTLWTQLENARQKITRTLHSINVTEAITKAATQTQEAIGKAITALRTNENVEAVVGKAGEAFEKTEEWFSKVSTMVRNTSPAKWMKKHMQAVPIEDTLAPSTVSDQDSFSPEVVQQAQAYARIFKDLKSRFNKRSRTNELVLQQLLNDITQVRAALQPNAELTRAVTIRTIPFIVRVMSGHDVLSYLNYYADEIVKDMQKLRNMVVA